MAEMTSLPERMGPVKSPQISADIRDQRISRESNLISRIRG